MRKFIFVRTEISFLPHGAKFPFGRKFSSVRTKILRRAAEVGLALLGDGNFPPRKRKKGPD